ncbi:MAG: spermidine/putrescine ABC transporter substrate-binding protein [Mogibacterium sp.]|nr:spermidine/putrescine ABC transporter substrate-binding protein [Mogibacterium sp.]
MKKKIAVIGLVFAMVFTMTALTSCGGGSGAGENGEVYVYCYGDYFDPEIIEDFEAETGIKVILDSYDTAEEMYPVIKNNAVDYDVVCTSDYMVEKMIKEGLLQPVDKSNIPNLENIDPVYLEKSEVFDPGNQYAVPHMVGVAGIVYNKTEVGDTVIDSWADLWDPKFADSIVMPDSVRDDFMISLRKLGYDQNTTDPKEIEAAANELIAQKPLVYKYANDAARDLLIDGSANIGVVWNGEYAYILDYNDDIGYCVPKEGTEFFIDSWVIPANAKNKANAEAWINYLCEADVAATNFEYLYYTTPNKAAYDLIDEEYLNNPAIFPTEDILARCDSLRTLDDETIDVYSNYWKQVKAS